MEIESIIIFVRKYDPNAFVIEAKGEPPFLCKSGYNKELARGKTVNDAWLNAMNRIMLENADRKTVDDIGLIFREHMTEVDNFNNAIFEDDFETVINKVIIYFSQRKDTHPLKEFI